MLVVGQQLVGLAVLGLHNLHNLGIHLGRGLLTAGKAGIAAQIRIVDGFQRYHVKIFGHTIAGHQGAGQLGGLFNIVAGAGGDGVENQFLGRTAAGTLTLTEDERGLYGVIKINTADGDAMNLYARVQRGDVSQCSFGFDILDEEYIINPDGSELWLIRKVKLYEVSVVTFPAYEETSVSARSADTPARRERRLAAWKNNMKERLEKCSK